LLLLLWLLWLLLRLWLWLCRNRSCEGSNLSLQLEGDSSCSGGSSSLESSNLII
jgi:hypothetical protein